MKNHKKAGLKVTGIALVVILLIVWGIQVSRVNQQTPQVQTKITEAGEWFQWKENVKLRTGGVRFMENDEIRSLYRLDDDETEPFPGMIIKLMWVTVTFKNDSSKSADIDILDVGASTSGWSNIPDYDFYYKIGNPKRQHHFELESQEEVTMDLPYLFVKPNFRNGQWEKIEGKEYFLVTSLYPIKHIMPVFSSICYINGVKNRNEATKMVIFNRFLHKNPILLFKNYSYIIYT